LVITIFLLYIKNRVEGDKLLHRIHYCYFLFGRLKESLNIDKTTFLHEWQTWNILF